MIIFANGNGDILRFVPQNVHQGSNKASTVYFVCPTGPNNLVNISFTLPDGKNRPPRIMQRVTDYTQIPELTDNNGNGYYIWSYQLIKSITALAGQVTAQISVTGIDEEIVTTSGVSFEVLKGVPPIEPPKDTDSYQDLLSYIVSVLSSLDYNELLNRPIINADLTLIEPTPNTYYRHTGQTNNTFVNDVIYFYNGVIYKAINGITGDAIFDASFPQTISAETLLKVVNGIVKTANEYSPILISNGEFFGVVIASSTGASIFCEVIIDKTVYKYELGENQTVTTTVTPIEKNINVDNELSSTSENPVQNKVIDSALSNLESTINTKVENEIAQVNNKIDTLHANAFVKVTELPPPSSETLGKIYLVATSSAAADNIYDEYITVIVDEVYKWEPIGTTRLELEGYIQEVQINGTSIVENGIANIPIANPTTPGVLKVLENNTYGVYKNSSGVISLAPADTNQILARQAQFAPLTAHRIDTIVKVGVTDNKTPLTEAEQDSALGWIGAIKKVLSTTQFNQAYVKTAIGAQTLFNISNDAEPNSLAFRSSSGTLRTADPINALDATPKRYVDDAIAAKEKVFEKIATVTVTPDTDGTLPTEILINTDDSGQPFVIRDFFFVATATHTIEGVSSAIVVVTGCFNKITKCQSGYEILSMPKGTFRQYPITFNTYGKNCGMLKVGKNGLAEGMIFGETSDYGGLEWYDIPTSPEVNLEEGINNVRFDFYGINYQPTEIAEGSKFELWGVRV